MKVLSQKLSRWLGSLQGDSRDLRWQQLAADTGGTSQAEWHLSGVRGGVTWRLPSLFADGEANPREEYLRWEATGLPATLACEIVPRLQYEAWAARQQAPGPEDASTDASLSKAISAFAETLCADTGRLAAWAPAREGLAVLDLSDNAQEDFALHWVVLSGDALTARHLIDTRLQAQWLLASEMLTDAQGRPATDLRLSLAGGTARLHTARAHQNMPLEAVQALVDLGLVLLEALQITGPDTQPAPAGAPD